MSVPKFDEFFEPILGLLSDGAEYGRKEIRAHCISAKHLTDIDLGETIPSGQNKFINRTNWACSYLKMAGLVAPGAKKGSLSITDSGKTVLGQCRGRIRLSLVKSLPEYKKHIAASKSDVADLGGEVCDYMTQTVEERMGSARDENNEAVKNNLREAVIERLNEYSFQILVKRLLEKMGYGLRKFSADITKKGPDGGVDGFVVADEFGFDTVLIQAKFYAEDNFVKTDDVKAFYATLTENGANRGVFCTTSSFHQPAYKSVDNYKDKRIVLVDGARLWELMLRYNVFVRDCETQYILKEFDEEAFNEFVEEHGGR